MEREVDDLTVRHEAGDILKPERALHDTDEDQRRDVPRSPASDDGLTTGRWTDLKLLRQPRPVPDM